jgi:outer membrane protein OmpA-like peptidoglycan-associated protein
MAERSARRLVAAAGLIIWAAGCVTGCTGVTTISESPAFCPWTTQPPAPPGTAAQSDTVIMIDISASFWPKTGQTVQQPDGLAQLVASEVETAFGNPGTRLVSLGLFDGSSTTIDWKLANEALPPATGDSQEIKGEAQAASQCLSSMVASAGRTAPQLPGTDVMAALAAAGQQLQGTPGVRDHVVLITDGLSNAGCLNLSKVISQGQSASSVLASCPEHADLAALRGVGLRLFGVGLQAASPPLTTAEQSWVVNYWRNLCSALGVASTASCVASAQADDARSSEVSRPGDPSIAFPAIQSGVTSVQVPADLLFAFNSATLSVGGQAYLDILLAQLKGQGRSITKVIGHTDAAGTQAYNLGLSQRRADAVQAYLARRGFSGVPAVGVGEADPACSPQYTSAGAPIESCMAKDRRVQILLGG